MKLPTTCKPLLLGCRAWWHSEVKQNWRWADAIIINSQLQTSKKKIMTLVHGGWGHHFQETQQGKWLPERADNFWVPPLYWSGPVLCPSSPPPPKTEITLAFCFWRGESGQIELLKIVEQVCVRQWCQPALGYCYKWPDPSPEINPNNFPYTYNWRI